jgi:microcompartment protein CcmK/EutM
MHLCKVVGTVTSTRKHPRLRRATLLLVQRVGLDGALLPNFVEEVALDPRFDAGVGDFVLTAKQGTVVQQLLDADLPPEAPRTPANVIIIAVVDDWETTAAP